MNSNKLLGLLTILFLVQVWSSDNEHNKKTLDDTKEEDKIEMTTTESDIKFQKEYDKMINYFGKKYETDIPSLLKKKILFDQNIDPHPKKSEDIRALVLYLSTSDDIKQDVFEFWHYIAFPKQDITVYTVITGSWENVKYFQFPDEEDFAPKFTIANMNGDINLDPTCHRLPKKLRMFCIKNSNITSLRFPEETNIDILMFEVHSTNVIRWGKIHLTKVEEFYIKYLTDDHMKSITDENRILNDIENIQNASDVKHLTLLYLQLPQELNLYQFTNLAKLTIDGCKCADEYSKVVLPKSIKEVDIEDSEIEGLHFAEETTTKVTKVAFRDLKVPKELDLHQFINIKSLEIYSCSCEDDHSKLLLSKHIDLIDIQSSNIENIHYSEETTIEKLKLAFSNEYYDGVRWENVHVPKVSTLEIHGIGNNTQKRHGLEKLQTIKNATHMETLVLVNLYIQKLDLRKFNNLKHLKFQNCYFESQNSEIMTPKKTTLFYQFKSTNEILKDNKDTAVTFVTYTYCKQPNKSLFLSLQ